MAKENKVSYPINMHHFMHPVYKAFGSRESITLELPVGSNIAKLSESDVIAMARHFNLINQ